MSSSFSPSRSLRTWLVVLVAVAFGTLAVQASGAAAATPPTLNLKVLLVGQGPTDTTTAAWAAALQSEGVPFTEVDATGTAPSESIALPTLSSGSTGYYNGVIIADSPTNYAAGQLTPLYTYESAFGIRQVDGYMYPSTALGATPATAGALDGTSGQLTTQGLAAFPGLAGTVPFSTGTYGYGATAVSGAAYTPLLTDSAGNAFAGVYVHPTTTGDPQGGVAELSLYFDYNAAQLQWEILAPSLINWVTNNTHLGLDRNYVEMNIDDTFSPDDAWDTTTHENAYNEADSLRMQPADVIYAAQWSKANNFRLDQLFNFGNSVAAQNGDLLYAGSTTAPSGYDPLLAQFQATDPTTGKPYADDFGWISHTYDTPVMDVGCATQNYIEAELNENTNSIAAAPGAIAGTGGLGLTTETTNQTASANPLGPYSDALGEQNATVFVPGNHSGFGNLVPGNPATVDPPQLDQSTSGTGGALAAGSYQYAVTDQFNGSDSPSVDQSAAYVTAPTSVPAGGEVTLNWQAICHAANYLIYREVAGSGNWSLVGSYATPSLATLPDNSSGNPASTTDVTGGGELELSWTDTGAAGTAQLAGWTPPITENAIELPWEQNPYFIPALQAVGITVVGDDASKAYPNPPNDQFGIGASYTGATYAAGQTFVDGTAQVAPRHPVNVYYNASTEAQEVDEYNTLYLSTADGGTCTDSSTTTCLTTPATFADIVNQVVSGMFNYMLNNDPRPSYVHQTNLLGAPPGCALSATTLCTPPATAPATADTTGDGLLYSVLDPLLNEYHQYFSAATPYEQPTLGAIGVILADQSAWAATQTAGTVTASLTNGVVTVANAGTSTTNVPITVAPGTTVNGSAFGQAYSGALSDWTSIPSGTSQTLTEAPVAPAITSSATATSIVGAPFSTTVDTTGIPAATITEAGALPAGVSFTNNGDGTATIAGTPAAGSGGTYPITLTATNSAGTTTQAFTLTNAQAPTITSPATAAFTTGLAGTYTMTTTGYPTATLTETGALPTGLTFVDNANGTGTISGTAAAGTAGTYPVSLSATNASGSTATLALTITVTDAVAPTITSGDSGFFTLNQAGAIGVTTTGSPTPTITETGALPPGLTFTDNGNGTALIQGAATAVGTTTVTVTAANGISPNATQTITIVVGQAPAFTSAATATAQLNTPFTDTVTTSGYPAPGFGWSNIPPGLSFTDNGNGTATISGTPTTSGTYTLPLTATNAYGTAQQALTINVTQPPAITSAPGATFTTGTLGTFTVTTTGSPSPAITETGALPSGVTLTDNHNGTAMLSGTAAAGTGGTYPITITAANGVGTNATQSFVLTVNAAQTAPTITSAAAATTTIGLWSSFEVTSTASPVAKLTESGALPSGVVFADNGNGTATISGAPITGTVGSYPITITAANGVGTNATQSFTLTVNPALTPPDFSNAGATTFAVGKAGTFAITSTGNPTPTLTYTTTPALPTGIGITNNNNGTLTLAGTAPAGSQGVYMVTATAANSAGTAVQTIALTVNSGLAITSAGSASATAGKAFSFTVTTTGTPTASLAETGTLPSGITFRNNSNGTATLSGTPGTTSGGTYPLTLTATNSTGSASQAFVLTVNQTPTFTSAASLTETAGTAFGFTVATSGSPTAALTAGSLPTGVSFSDNGTGTGLLSGTTAVPAGTYSIALTATNAGGTATQTITLTVKAAGSTTNQKVPSFTSAATATVTAGSALNFSVTTLGVLPTTISESGTLPSGVTFRSNSNGTATLSGTPSSTSGGTYPITLTASNTSGTVTQSFVLTVNARPSISSGTSASATVGATFNFTVTAHGAPTPNLTEAGALPTGVTFVDNANGTATIAGTPGVAQGGVYRLTITATNTFGSTSQTFTLTVSQAPSITSAATATATHGKAFTFTFTSSGYPAATLSRTGTVAGLNFATGANGTATLSGTPTTAGTYSLTITATNSVGTATQTFVLTVS